MPEIPYGEYEHPLGTLEVKAGINFDPIFILRLREPINNMATAEWYFNPDGTFDGTGTELAEPVEEVVPV